MKFKSFGFTLVELLIVISIISVLVAIGVAFYGNAQRGARDAERRIEIDAIDKALEMHYNNVAGEACVGGLQGQYCQVAAAWFEDGVIPTDPLSTRAYCITTPGNGTTIPAAWTTTCPATTHVSVGGGTNSQGNYRVCATLETNNTVFCKANSR